jgi:hypothetical protein
VAPVAGCWRLQSDAKSALWSTGLEFEKICALLRRAAGLLLSEHKADGAIRACVDIQRAAGLSSGWNTDPVVFQHWPEVSSEGLLKLSKLAWAVAHARAIRTVDQAAARAGLWRSLNRALAAVEEPEDGELESLAVRGLRAAAVHAECEAALQSAWHHFDACRAGAARACSARAVERARAEHVRDPEVVCSERVSELQAAFERMHSVAQRVEGGSRIFDATLLCDCIALPKI